MNRNRRNPGKELASTPSTPQPVEMALESVIVDKDVENIKAWIKRISQRHQDMGGFSICPYAASSSWTVKRTSLSDVAPIEGVDVAIFIVGDVSLESLMRRCSELNMMYGDYIFLEDHISETSYIQGHQTHYGLDNLILIQRKDKLLKEREILHSTKYYQYWSEELYNKVIKKG